MALCSGSPAGVHLVDRHRMSCVLCSYRYGEFELDNAVQANQAVVFVSAYSVGEVVDTALQLALTDGRLFDVMAAMILSSVTPLGSAVRTAVIGTQGAVLSQDFVKRVDEKLRELHEALRALLLTLGSGETDLLADVRLRDLHRQFCPELYTQEELPPEQPEGVDVDV